MFEFSFRSFFRRFLPFVFCLCLLTATRIPFHFLPNYPFATEWILIPIFYFAIYHPKCLSSWAVFLLGLFSDLMTQSSFGVMTFCYVLVFFIANFLRKYLVELNFWALWGVFATLLFLILNIEYLLVSLQASTFVAAYPIFVEFWVLILAYPFLMRFCAYLDRKIREAL